MGPAPPRLSASVPWDWVTAGPIAAHPRDLGGSAAS
jgi:hypothetical protein